MSLQGMRKEIKELRNSILYRSEPVCKTFVLGKEDSSNDEEISAFKAAHPHTHVILLYKKDCGKDSLK